MSMMLEQWAGSVQWAGNGARNGQNAGCLGHFILRGTVVEHMVRKHTGQLIGSQQPQPLLRPPAPLLFQDLERGTRRA